MSTIVVFANTEQNYPWDLIPNQLIPARLLQAPQSNNLWVQQKFKSRRLAHFLLWQSMLKLGLSPETLLDINLHSNGRPFINKPNIDFNLSHSGIWVALIISSDITNQSKLGIDIEQPTKNRPFEKILNQYASSAENDWFLQQANPTDAFYRTWCLREAILKTQGIGIRALSSVVHNPENLNISSPYAPIGQLYFSSELPFYLAFFLPDNIPQQQVKSLVYTGKQSFESLTLSNLIAYQVNKN